MGCLVGVPQSLFLAQVRPRKKRGQVPALGPIWTVRCLGAAALQIKNVYLVCPMVKKVASTCEV
jgi:hypothetical protein